VVWVCAGDAATVAPEAPQETDWVGFGADQVGLVRELCATDARVLAGGGREVRERRANLRKLASVPVARAADVVAAGTLACVGISAPLGLWASGWTPRKLTSATSLSSGRAYLFGATPEEARAMLSAL